MSRVVQQGRRAAEITPNDGVDIPTSTVARPAIVFVGVGGDVKVTAIDGGDVVFKNLPDGSFLPVQCSRVWATGTTATDLVAIFDS